MIRYLHIIKGTVKKGDGKAARFTEVEWVQQQCRQNFGFYPYPGTLNLEVDQKTSKDLAKLDGHLWKTLVPPDDSLCSSTVLKVFVNNIPAVLIKPEKAKNIHKENIVEVMSPLYMRQVFSLQDGDTVSLEIKKGSVSEKKEPLCVKAVLFDLDGTLIDSVGLYFKIVEITLNELGFPKVSKKIIAAATKSEGFDWQMVFPAMDESVLKNKIKKAWQIIEKVYPDLFLNNVDIFPGTDRVLKELNARNIQIGIVTATPKKNIKDKLSILQQYQLLEYIDHIICSDDAPNKKPYPDPLILCSEKMNLKRDQCVYIGDVGTDMIAGKAAGMKTIGITTGFETRKELQRQSPDIIIDSISALLSCVHI